MLMRLVGLVLTVAVCTGGTAIGADEPVAAPAKLAGTWRVVEFVFNNRALSKEQLARADAVITADRLTLRLPELPTPNRIELTYKTVLSGIDLLAEDDEPGFAPLLGAFELRDDTLRIAFSNIPQDGERPLRPGPGEEITYFVLKKVMP